MNKQVYHITIQGNPIPLQRHRYAYRKGKMTSYDDQKSKKVSFAWRCRAEVMGELKMISGAFRLYADFYISTKVMPKKLEGMPRIKRPDIDNYFKFVLDALQGSFWDDDAHCVFIEGGKYHSKDPRTELSIYLVEDE